MRRQMGELDGWVDGWIKDRRWVRRERDYERERERRERRASNSCEGKLISNQYINMQNYINRNSHNTNSF